MSHQRQPFLICYDIGCPRRWRRVFMAVKDWATPMQKSVFVGWFGREELESLLKELEEHIHAEEDSVQVYELRQPEPGHRLGLSPTSRQSWTV
jgi:CRISPR-associated protein Cas2